jgi:hypothetical protein
LSCSALPTLWHADSTTPQDRQIIARLLLEQATVTIEGNTDRVDLELRWAGGFVSRHTLSHPVQTYQQLSRCFASAASANRHAVGPSRTRSN